MDQYAFQQLATRIAESRSTTPGSARLKVGRVSLDVSSVQYVYSIWVAHKFETSGTPF